MSFVSMTGFGRGTASSKEVHVEIELASVNRKQLDIQLTLPRFCAGLEPQITALIREHLSRGRVTGKMALIHTAGLDGGVTLNERLAETCVQRLQALAGRLKMDPHISMDTIACIPGVLEISEPTPDLDRLWPVVETALRQALANLLAMRLREGKVLARDIRSRVQTLEKLARVIRKRAPIATQEHREAMRLRLAEAGLDVLASDERLRKEWMILADRSDIAEELTRMDSHFVQVREWIESKEPAGRTLDFLCQELNREINTTGSKSQDAAIARAVIDFKAELERLREQVQNIE